MLENGVQLPSIPAKDLEGNTVDIGRIHAADDASNWTVVLFYRGHW